MSLNAMSLNIFNKEGKSLSKQAIDSRFSEKSILFIKTVLDAYLLKINNSLCQGNREGWMDLFNRVLVKDGTRFDLPKSFANHFKGFGGNCTSDSAICIQFEYDLKKGMIAELKTTSANIPDSKDAQVTKDAIQEGDLILRDLGYFNLKILSEMQIKKASYISKLNTQVLVYELNNGVFEMLDFVKLKNKFSKSNCQCIEIDVFIGKIEKIPVRLIIEHLSLDAYEERMRNVQKRCKRKGLSITNKYIARQYFNCYITNISKETLSSKSIREIYRLRWQIELVFKVWKSTYKINTISKMKYERWMTLFYARLFLMLVHWHLFNYVKIAKFKIENKLLSLLKSMKSLRLRSEQITKLINNTETTKSLVQELIQLLSSKHDQEMKKGRKNQEEIIDIIYCISVI